MAGDYLIDVQFETASTTKSTGTQNGQWLTHPAFTFGGQELEGFWMAKFETGYKDATITSEAEINTLDPTKIIVKPSVYSWRGIQVVNMYKNAQGMKDASNPYGFTGNEDPHMAKNMEWGAMAYLTQSKYGKIGNGNYSSTEKRIRTNVFKDRMTGCGSVLIATKVSDVCDTYETMNGQAASTTGNITGIYDTAGGMAEYVTAVQRQASGDIQVGESGFSQTELNRLGNEGKYFDVYLSNGSYDNYSEGKLGDATREMGPFSKNRSSWFNSFAYALAGNGSWIIRGASLTDFTTSGPAAFSCSNANAFSNTGYRITAL